ncbi:protein ENHANCED DOWNY MILDEW 2-like isoform X2 [Nymphaea colorata]|uniref:protein ENHANCED DOWNY MILDEW 2-like isoform X2 n=1 Tax=Nymphaea colorata TaxID=210225 RepID=UPI00129EC076|nr:protein ENHANCED DOWNY MILDEW 2-like isoform X2 [Nymphaea colorata]
MFSSDEEDDVILEKVSNYYFVDETDQPISFTVLPFQTSTSELRGHLDKRIFMCGDVVSTNSKMYEPVAAWKLELSDLKPTVCALTSKREWIEMFKPCPAYEETIRGIMVTVHCLHFAYTNPGAAGTDLWPYLRKKLIDETLAKSKVIQTITGEVPERWRFPTEGMNEVPKEADGNLYDLEDGMDSFDHVCAICDNGGEILCCEGPCLRSFHPTVEAGSDSYCITLGLSNDQVKDTQNFFCSNCQHKKHQCFACGLLGHSDKSANPEVFSCASAICGHFYHPKCVVQLLYPEGGNEALVHKKRIAAGEPFICPIHKCIVCKRGENKDDNDLQFAICRRCPKVYHRKCLPRKISFEETEEMAQRAWNGLIPNRILIYCLNHEIDRELGTPTRDHIIFPKAPGKKVLPILHEKKMKNTILQQAKVASQDFVEEEMDSAHQTQNKAGLTLKGTKPSIRNGNIAWKNVAEWSKPEFSSGMASSLKDIRITKSKYMAESPKKYKVHENRLMMRSNCLHTPSVKKSISSQPLVDSGTEKRIMTLVQHVKSSLTLEDIIKGEMVTSNYSHNSRQGRITFGRVEASVEAVKIAWKKLEEGCSIEAAKSFCEPWMLNEMMKWKKKLNIYLAPFLYGPRYTSFGRHFTSIPKLKEIVDMLHWYVASGDTIVDFSCGSNDFSWLLKTRLEQTGKKCFYKNYDIFHPKINFEFERRDWMSVSKEELPPGNGLIMGLNPPFGVRASHANRFINKALSFDPKLLVLIVPPETERLNEKRYPYDLVWEDAEKLKGKAFYLPGSLDQEDKELAQWNIVPPVLYLWSRPDWTDHHRTIAIQQGHTTEREIASKERGKPMKVIKKQKVQPAVLGVVSKSEISIIGNQNRPHSTTHACTSTGSGGLHVSASAGDWYSYSQKGGMPETGNQDCASNSGHGYSTHGETQVQLPTLVNDNIPETFTSTSKVYSSHYGLMHASGFDATMQPSPYGQHTAYGSSCQFDATLHPSSYPYEQYAAYGFSHQSGSDSSFGMSDAAAGHGYAGLTASAPQGYAPHPFYQASPSATSGAFDQVSRPWPGSSYNGSMLSYPVQMPPYSVQQEQLNPQVATATEDLMNSSMSHHKG